MIEKVCAACHELIKEENSGSGFVKNTPIFRALKNI
jgi:hypothetical protein